MRHVNDSLPLRSLRGSSQTSSEEDGLAPAQDAPYAATLSAAVVGDALRAISRDAFSFMENASDSLSSSPSSDPSTSATDSQDGRETPPPSYAATLVPPAYSEVASATEGSAAPAAPGTRSRQAQRRRDLILAMAARRGRDLNQLDPPPSYAVCVGDTEAVGDTDAFTEFARGARTLNQSAADRDAEALLPQDASRCSASSACLWLPLGIICTLVFGLSALSVLSSYSQRDTS